MISAYDLTVGFLVVFLQEATAASPEASPWGSFWPNALSEAIGSFVGSIVAILGSLFIFYRSTEQRRSEERQQREESRAKEMQRQEIELAGISLLLLVEIESDQAILGIYVEEPSRLETYPRPPTKDIWEQSK